MGKALRQFAANRLSLTQKERDDAERAIVEAIDQTLPVVVQMMERYPFFRETGKRMLIEWDSGKLDITEAAKKRLGKKTDVLDEMKLSDVKVQKKKNAAHSDSPFKMKK
jgi:hypothetical protein